MADSSFYVVYIERLESISYETLEEKMNLCRSWYRLNEKMWIVCSTSDIEKLYRRFNPLVKRNGSLFICKLDVEIRQGWMNKRFWAWLRKNTPDSSS